MNSACLDICKERFKYYPIEQHFFENDGADCSMVNICNFDLIACFDSMVHMHPDIAKGYIQQLSKKLKLGGLMFLDHPGEGAKSQGHRTNIFLHDISNWGAEVGLTCIYQKPRNNKGDYLSLLKHSEIPTL
jgi:hypothetical protein